MGLMDNGGDNGMVMPVAPMYGGGYGGGFGNGFGCDGWWILLLFILLGGNNGWGNGFGANGGGTTYVANDVQRGFDQAALTSGINGISTSLCNGFSNVQQSLCNGFAGVNQTVSNGFAQAEISNNARQMADMNQQFALQSQLAQCCCDNRLATSQTQNIIQNEGNATRIADANNTRDILTAFNSGVQSIKDQLCNYRDEQKDETIANLRQELLFARGQASQVAQNAAIINGVYNRLNECPVGTVPVFGEQPIFTCPTNVGNGNFGCGCGCNPVVA